MCCKDLVFVVVILCTLVIVPFSSAAAYAQQQPIPQGLSTSSNQTNISPQGIQENAYLKVITTVKNNNTTAPYHQQLQPRDVEITIRGILPFNNQVTTLLNFYGLDKGWNFTFPAGTQYDVYLFTIRLPYFFNVNHSFDCSGILKAGETKTCVITVTLPPPQSSVMPSPSNQAVGPGPANATAGLTNSTK